MMIKCLFFTGLFAVTLFNAQNVSFEDSNFKKAILTSYPYVDVNKDGEISFEEAQTLKEIRNLRSYVRIKSVKGIEAFVNLTELNLGKHELTSIDLSHNLKLKTINLRENQLQGSLDLSMHSELTNLELSKNELTTLMLPKSGSLVFLYVNENRLMKLDTSDQKSLRRFFAVGNYLQNLDLSENKQVERLHLDKNQLSYIDLKDLPRLSWVSVVENQLSDIELKNNTALKTLLAGKNKLIKLNFRGDELRLKLNLVNVTDNPNFESIEVDCQETINKVLPVGIAINDDCSSLSVVSSSVGIRQLGPNPFVDVIYLKGFSKPRNVNIYGMDGRLIKQIKTISNSAVNLEDLPESSIYVVTIEDDKGNYLFRLMKK